MSGVVTVARKGSPFSPEQRELFHYLAGQAAVSIENVGLHETVERGDLGENITLGGVPESSLAPGVRLRLGRVELQISKPCVPCSETYSLPYIGPERGPAFVRALVGRRGWYARVLREGRLDLTTPVVLDAGD